MQTPTPSRRGLLRAGGLLSLLGTAGCLGVLNDDTGSADVASAEFSFEYDAGRRRLTVTYDGGGSVVAGKLQIRGSDGTRSAWNELGSTSKAADEILNTGDTAVVGSDILNWGTPVGPDATIQLVYMVDGGSPSTLARFAGESTATSEPTPTADSSATPTEPVERAGGWPQAMFDARNTNEAPSRSVPSEVPSVAWTFQTERQVRGVPAIRDGIVYLTSKDGNLYAVDAESGSERWRYETPGTGWTTPALAEDVAIFASSNGGTVHAVHLDDGSGAWRFETGGEIWRSVTIADGAVFVGSGDNNCYALNPADGSEVWRYETGGSILSVPAVDGDAVYTASHDNRLHAIDRKTGEGRWQTVASRQEKPLIGNPTAVGDVVVQSGRGGPLRGFDVATGETRWETDEPAGGATTYDDLLLYTTESDELRAADPDTGETRWQLSDVSVGQVFGEKLLYTREGNRFGLVDLAARERVWESSVETRLYGGPVVVDGRVYLPGGDGALYALR